MEYILGNDGDLYLTTRFSAHGITKKEMLRIISENKTKDL